MVVALYINAALLACVLVAMLSRGNSSVAFAAPPEGMRPIAGGNGIYLMPGQFAINIWGCYVMDVERQTLCAYEYVPGRKQLQFVAARSIAYDRDLKDWNTTPSPEEIKRLGDLEKAPVRGQPEDNGPRPQVPGVQDQPPVQPPSGGATTAPGGERPLSRPPQPGDPDFVPKASDINNPPE